MESFFGFISDEQLNNAHYPFSSGKFRSIACSSAPFPRAIKSAFCWSRTLFASVNVVLTRNSQAMTIQLFCQPPIVIRHRPQAVKQTAAPNAVQTANTQAEVAT